MFQNLICVKRFKKTRFTRKSTAPVLGQVKIDFVSDKIQTNLNFILLS